VRAYYDTYAVSRETALEVGRRLGEKTDRRPWEEED